MAKLASKSHKPSGCTVIPFQELDAHLIHIPIGKVWGIGSSTTIAMRKKGIVTAFDLAHKDPSWVTEHFARPVVEIYEELRVRSVLPLNKASEHEYASIQRTRTFKPPSSDSATVFSELSQNVEEAAHRLRKLRALRRTRFILPQDASIQLFRHRDKTIAIRLYAGGNTSAHSRTIQKDISAGNTLQGYRRDLIRPTPRRDKIQ